MSKFMEVYRVFFFCLFLSSGSPCLIGGEGATEIPELPELIDPSQVGPRVALGLMTYAKFIMGVSWKTMTRDPVARKRVARSWRREVETHLGPVTITPPVTPEDVSDIKTIEPSITPSPALGMTHFLPVGVLAVLYGGRYPHLEGVAKDLGPSVAEELEIHWGEQPRLPVTYTTLIDELEMAYALSLATGRKFRLPTRGEMCAAVRGRDLSGRISRAAFWFLSRDHYTDLKFPEQQWLIEQRAWCGGNHDFSGLHTLDQFPAEQRDLTNSTGMLEPVGRLNTRTLDVLERCPNGQIAILSGYRGGSFLSHYPWKFKSSNWVEGSEDLRYLDCGPRFVEVLTKPVSH